MVGNLIDNPRQNYEEKFYFEPLELIDGGNLRKTYQNNFRMLSSRMEISVTVSLLEYFFGYY